MNRKRKNPFAGMANPRGDNAKSPENMSMWELTEELRRMEKALGKEQFNRLMEKAVEEYEFSREKDELDHEGDDLLDPVTTYEWNQTHPANLVCASDKYYADLATDFYELIYYSKIPVRDPDPLARELGRVLAAYLEDIVSGTKVFSAMRRVCMQKYGYRLPFYDCDHEDYMPDHINEEDIRFLIWKTACQLGKNAGITYSPLASGWALLAEKAFDELNSRYEEAPEATRVTDWLRRSFRKEDYIDKREIASWLVFRNPLSYIPGFLDSVEQGVQEATMKEDLDLQTIAQLSYAYMAKESWQRSMSAMGCPSKTLVSALASEFGYDSIAKDIEEIEVLPKQIYALSQNRKSRQLFFETSGHEILQVERDSLAKGFKPDMIGYAECNLLKFKGKYLLNGMLHGDPGLKEEWEKQHPFLTFEQQQEYARDWIERLDGKQAVCVTNLKTLFRKLNLPSKTTKDFPDAKDYVVLLSKELGVSILPDVGYAFDIPGNRFFRKREAAKQSFNDLIFNNGMPYDVAMYIQDNHLLPEACIGASQGKETGRRIVQDYIAFWIGFYCELPAYGDTPRLEYYGKPDIEE